MKEGENEGVIHQCDVMYDVHPPIYLPIHLPHQSSKNPCHQKVLDKPEVGLSEKSNPFVNGMLEARGNIPKHKVR